MKSCPGMKSALVFVVLLVSSTSSFAMPIFVDATPGLDIQEPGWNLSAFPLQIEVESNDTIDQVKNIINSTEPSISVDNQVLFFGSLELNDASTLADYNIQKNDRLDLASNRVSAVSEPASLALLALGLSGMGFVRRRKRA